MNICKHILRAGALREGVHGWRYISSQSQGVSYLVRSGCTPMTSSLTTQHILPFMQGSIIKDYKILQPSLVGDKQNYRSIVDPKHVNFEINIPEDSLRHDLTLPTLMDRELIEPVAPTVTEKKAARLIVIRKRKMKKHKYKKLQKRMKFVFAKRRQKRELKKEKAFQAVLIDQIKVAEQFSAKEYVAQKLEKAHWTPPITKIKGLLCPDWVIQEHLNKKEKERRIQRKIDECLKFKK